MSHKYLTTLITNSDLIEAVKKNGFLNIVDILEEKNLDGQAFLDLSEWDLKMNWRTSPLITKSILQCQQRIRTNPESFFQKKPRSLTNIRPNLVQMKSPIKKQLEDLLKPGTSTDKKGELVEDLNQDMRNLALNKKPKAEMQQTQLPLPNQQKIKTKPLQKPPVMSEPEELGEYAEIDEPTTTEQRKSTSEKIKQSLSLSIRREKSAKKSETKNENQDDNMLQSKKMSRLLPKPPKPIPEEVVTDYVCMEKKNDEEPDRDDYYLTPNSSEQSEPPQPSLSGTRSVSISNRPPAAIPRPFDRESLTVPNIYTADPASKKSSLSTTSSIDGEYINFETDSVEIRQPVINPFNRPLPPLPSEYVDVKEPMPLNDANERVTELIYEEDYENNDVVIRNKMPMPIALISEKGAVGNDAKFSPSSKIDNIHNDPFFRYTDQKGAKLLLKNCINGAFLFRPSRENYLAITFKYNDTYFKMGIHKTNTGKLKIDGEEDSYEFNNTTELVDHYTKNPLTFASKDNKVLGIYLKRALPLDLY